MNATTIPHDECPAGGSHRYVNVPAGIETGLHSPGWLCDECSASAPRLDIDGYPIPEPVFPARTLTAADLLEDEMPF